MTRLFSPARGTAALALSALLLMAGVTGCGNKDESATAPAPSAAPSATPTAANPPGPPPGASGYPGGPGYPGGTMMNKPSTNPNGAAGDAVITAKVKSALIADTKVGATKINVDTKSGTVVLRGSVTSAGAKTAAEQDAKKMQGVTKVINQLTVSP